MTGHLAALAATALGATPRVVPRPRSRFEPLGAFDPSDNTIVERTTQPPLDGDGGWGPRAPDVRLDRLARPAAPPEASETAAPAPAMPHTPRSVPTPPASVEAHPADSPRRGRRREGGATAPARPAADVPPAAPVRSAAAGGRAGAVPPPDEPPDHPWSRPVRRDEAATAWPIPSAPGSPQRRQQPTRAEGVLLPAGLPTSAPAPVVTTPPAPRSAAGAIAPPPDVHVTIGRLEVRTAPDARAPSAVRPRPEVRPRTLEEYGAARRAAGGGRR